MKEHNENVLPECFNKCMTAEFSEEVRNHIQDLELLIERHTQQRYGEEDYLIGFYKKDLFTYHLTSEEADSIVYFLTFLLFNFPERAGFTAHAIKKCYGYDLFEACYNGINLYMQKDDFATINLMEFILNNMTRDQIPPKVWDLFNVVLQNGLPYSIKYLNKRVFSQNL
jgi:hypothetical protein